MAISAGMVRELRDRTGAAMMECKKALEATGGDLEEAIDHLRKAGLKTAEKKASREMAEGRVHALIAADGRSGCMIAVQCETDFAAGTSEFQGVLDALAEHVLENDPTGVSDGDDPLLAQRSARTDGTVELWLKEMVGKLRENLRVGDLRRFQTEGGWVHSYVHHDYKQGALVVAETGKARGDAEEVLKGVCQHIVVFRPTYLTRDEVPADVIARERAIYLEEVKGKPENIQDKIIGGKLEKFYASVCLLEQPWVFDDKLSVKKAIENALGKDARLLSFARFRIGE